jgi:hypothetical protein
MKAKQYTTTGLNLALQKYIDTNHWGNNASAAREFECSKASLGQFLNGHGEPPKKVLEYFGYKQEATYRYVRGE